MLIIFNISSLTDEENVSINAGTSGELTLLEKHLWGLKRRERDDAEGLGNFRGQPLG